MKKLFALLLAAVMALMTMTGCSAINSFEDQVKKGDYSKAVELYNSKLLGNAQSEQEANAFLENLLDETWAKFVNGEIPGQEYENCFATIQKVNNEIDVFSDLDERFLKYTAVKESKENYSKGMSHANEGAYIDAITELSAVIAEDTENYEKAQTSLEVTAQQFAQETITNAAGLLEKDDYSGAIALLKVAISSVSALEAKGDFVDSILIRLYQDMIDKSAKAGDYVTVINQYGEAAGRGIAIPADIKENYATSVTNYLNDISQKAEAAFGDNKDYTAASEVLRAEIANVVADESVVSEIEKKIEEYSAYAPVMLTSLEYTQKTNYIKIGNADDGEATDANGNVYDAATVIQPKIGTYEDPKTDEMYVIYNLNFNYSTLSGTIYRTYHSLSSTRTWANKTTCKIYGDDVLLYEAPNFTKETYDPVVFSIDVTGVRNLKIVMNGVWTQPSGWFYDIYYPKICMAEATLQK